MASGATASSIWARYRPVAAGTLSLGATFFSNAGTLAASGGGILALGDASFVNTGTISVGLGSAVAVTLFDYYASPNAGASVFTNSGVIAMQGGVLQEPTGNGLFPQVPLLNLPGGRSWEADRSTPRSPIPARSRRAAWVFTWRSRFLAPASCRSIPAPSWRSAPWCRPARR